MNAVWLVIAASLSLFIGYRYYSQFITRRVLRLNAQAITPAHRYRDGLDYVPTNKYIVFGHHFAAIAGAGPLVGPILSAQMGYLPSTLWILAGVIFAGAVQDFIILTISIRHGGRSLGDLIKHELGWLPGLVALFSIFCITIILLAVLALIVVKALASSPWSLFTVVATIPIAVFMGIYLRYLRPGCVAEVSIIGFVLLVLAIVMGGWIARHPILGQWFTLNSVQVMWFITLYGCTASILPIWFLLAPRDYLSTFMKVGTILALALAILAVAPILKMPAVTPFIDGTGPVYSGALFPFLFITIACGAISGFHSLIASGTTPKMINNEKDARFVGYGAMLLEAFVAMMALIAATCLEPGIYFALNSSAAVIGHTVESAAHTISQWGYVLTPEMLRETANNIGETTIISRTGGAPTLAIGMSQLFSQMFTNKSMLAFWYHFAILFEAIFILSAVDAGTRVGRFVLQDLIGQFWPRMQQTKTWFANILATLLCVGAWGYFLYQGVVDPFGGINTLWPLFGLANQMLAAIALILATVVLLKTNRVRYAMVTFLPLVWILIYTLTGTAYKLFSNNPAIGFLAHANKYLFAANDNIVLAPATHIAQMYQIVFNDRVNSLLVAIFASVIIFLTVWGVVFSWRIIANKTSPVTPYPDLSEPPASNHIDRCC